MSEQKKYFKLSKDIPLTLLVPIIGCICSVAILFYRVEILEKNSINTQALYERLTKLEVTQNIMLEILRSKNNDK